MCELLQGIWNLKSEWMKMNCTLWLQLVILVCKYEPIYISRIKKRWPWHRSRSRQIHSATVFQHFVIIVIINRTMCVFMWKFSTLKWKQLICSQLTQSRVQFLRLSLIVFSDHAYSRPTCVCQLYLLALRFIYWDFICIHDLVCRIVCLSWRHLFYLIIHPVFKSPSLY